MWHIQQKKIIEQNQYENIDYNLLIRACLLHDVGRTAKDICLMDKVTSVLLGKFLPQKVNNGLIGLKAKIK